MAENLKTTKYKDGTEIPLVTNTSSWPNLTSAGYCWYNNDISNKDIYGALYNWYAVGTGKLCPVDWHMPTREEFLYFQQDILGGWEIAGGKIKATGTLEESNGLWHYPNTAATNETGFTGLPGGAVNSNFGIFENLGYHAHWWLATDLDVNNGLRFGANYNSSVGTGLAIFIDNNLYQPSEISSGVFYNV